MSSEIKNFAASVKARLLNKAREMSRPFDELLRYYGIERFLYRLSLTPYGNSFVLKGGLIFVALEMPDRRPTRDIDLRGFTKNSVENLIQIVAVACQQPVPNDGMIFHAATVLAEKTQLDADYEGIRVSFLGMLGKAEIPMQIDIGFTDDITPQQVKLSYPTLLDMERPILYMYPPETVISEKFHAIVHLGELNSRMKDYYDIWLLSNRYDFNGSTLQDAITQTFKRRQTTMPHRVPPGLSTAFAVEHRRDWLIFLTRFGQENSEFNDIDLVLKHLRSFLMPPVEAIAQGTAFNQRWTAGKVWE